MSISTAAGKESGALARRRRHARCRWTRRAIRSHALLQNDVNLAALAATCTDRPWLPASAEAYA